MWSAINVFFSAIAAASLSFIVLHPNIREGLFIKLGLMVMIVSLLASMLLGLTGAPLSAAFNVGVALRAGILIVCFGYAVKYRKAKREGGPTDFGSLTER